MIDYFLPSSAREAFIGVYDLNGAQKLHLTLTNRGSSQVMIEEGTLSAGLYIYNMVVDGQEIASYRMVVTD